VPTFKLMYMGDSITEEVLIFPDSYRRATCYSRLVAAGYDVELVGRQVGGSFPSPHHEGWSGFRIDQLDALLEAALTANPPDLIYFMGGTNECAQLLSTSGAHLTALLNHLGSYSYQTRIMVSTITPMDPSAPGMPVGAPALQVAFNAAIPGIITTQRALGQHVHLSTAGGSLTFAELLGDGIHPSTAGLTHLGNLDADAILALYSLTGATLPGRISVTLGKAGSESYRVTVSPIGAGNAIKAVRFGERLNVESVLGLQLADMAFDDGSIAFTIQRISPLDASLELTITDGGGDWTTSIEIAAGPD
jgi:hypothetical protein